MRSRILIASAFALLTLAGSPRAWALPHPITAKPTVDVTNPARVVVTATYRPEVLQGVWMGRVYWGTHAYYKANKSLPMQQRFEHVGAYEDVTGTTQQFFLENLPSETYMSGVELYCQWAGTSGYQQGGTYMKASQKFTVGTTTTPSPGGTTNGGNGGIIKNLKFKEISPGTLEVTVKLNLATANFDAASEELHLHYATDSYFQNHSASGYLPEHYKWGESTVIPSKSTKKVVITLVGLKSGLHHFRAQYVEVGPVYPTCSSPEDLKCWGTDTTLQVAGVVPGSVTYPSVMDPSSVSFTNESSTRVRLDFRLKAGMTAPYDQKVVMKVKLASDPAKQWQSNLGREFSLNYDSDGIYTFWLSVGGSSTSLVNDTDYEFRLVEKCTVDTSRYATVWKSCDEPGANCQTGPEAYRLRTLPVVPPDDLPLVFPPAARPSSPAITISAGQAMVRSFQAHTNVGQAGRPQAAQSMWRFGLQDPYFNQAHHAASEGALRALGDYCEGVSPRILASYVSQETTESRTYRIAAWPLVNADKDILPNSYEGAVTDANIREFLVTESRCTACNLSYEVQEVLPTDQGRTSFARQWARWAIVLKYLSEGAVAAVNTMDPEDVEVGDLRYLGRASDSSFEYFGFGWRPSDQPADPFQWAETRIALVTYDGDTTLPNGYIDVYDFTVFPLSPSREPKPPDLGRELSILTPTGSTMSTNDKNFADAYLKNPNSGVWIRTAQEYLSFNPLWQTVVRSGNTVTETTRYMLVYRHDHSDSRGSFFWNTIKTMTRDPSSSYPAVSLFRQFLHASDDRPRLVSNNPDGSLPPTLAQDTQMCAAAIADVLGKDPDELLKHVHSSDNLKVISREFPPASGADRTRRFTVQFKLTSDSTLALHQALVTIQDTYNSFTGVQNVKSVDVTFQDGALG